MAMGRHRRRRPAAPLPHDRRPAHTGAGALRHSLQPLHRPPRRGAALDGSTRRSRLAHTAASLPARAAARRHPPRGAAPPHPRLAPHRVGRRGARRRGAAVRLAHRRIGLLRRRLLAALLRAASGRPRRARARPAALKGERAAAARAGRAHAGLRAGTARGGASRASGVEPGASRSPPLRRGDAAARKHAGARRRPRRRAHRRRAALPELRPRQGAGRDGASGDLRLAAPQPRQALRALSPRDQRERAARAAQRHRRRRQRRLHRRAHAVPAGVHDARIRDHPLAGLGPADPRLGRRFPAALPTARSAAAARRGRGRRRQGRGRRRSRSLARLRAALRAAPRAAARLDASRALQLDGGGAGPRGACARRAVGRARADRVALLGRLNFWAGRLAAGQRRSGEGARAGGRGVRGGGGGRSAVCLFRGWRGGGGGRAGAEPCRRGDSRALRFGGAGGGRRGGVAFAAQAGRAGFGRRRVAGCRSADLARAADDGGVRVRDGHADGVRLARRLRHVERRPLAGGARAAARAGHADRAARDCAHAVGRGGVPADGGRGVLDGVLAVHQAPPHPLLALGPRERPAARAERPPLALVRPARQGVSLRHPLRVHPPCGLRPRVGRPPDHPRAPPRQLRPHGPVRALCARRALHVAHLALHHRHRHLAPLHKRRQPLAPARPPLGAARLRPPCRRTRGGAALGGGDDALPGAGCGSTVDVTSPLHAAPAPPLALGALPRAGGAPGERAPERPAREGGCAGAARRLWRSAARAAVPFGGAGHLVAGALDRADSGRVRVRVLPAHLRGSGGRDPRGSAGRNEAERVLALLDDHCDRRGGRHQPHVPLRADVRRDAAALARPLPLDLAGPDGAAHVARLRLRRADRVLLQRLRAGRGCHRDVHVRDRAGRRGEARARGRPSRLDGGALLCRLLPRDHRLAHAHHALAQRRLRARHGTDGARRRRQLLRGRLRDGRSPPPLARARDDAPDGLCGVGARGGRGRSCWRASACVAARALEGRVLRRPVGARVAGGVEALDRDGVRRAPTRIKRRSVHHDTYRMVSAGCSMQRGER
mmetsp:Transcript_15162/g.43492  ORF Transcript_15162/g.43492 Transcript_15162/m.43492 type:complete len:1060 (+) Transcript_15162:1249-4428(+)